MSKSENAAVTEHLAGLSGDRPEPAMIAFRKKTGVLICRTIENMLPGLKALCETAPNQCFVHRHPASGQELKLRLNRAGELIAQYRNVSARHKRPIWQIGPVTNPNVGTFVLQYCDTVLVPLITELSLLMGGEVDQFKAQMDQMLTDAVLPERSGGGED